MLNGTAVDSGRRIITSDLQLRSRIRQPGELAEGEVLDILLSAELLKDAPIRLSTAAHQSARFTYFGPAGRFPDGTRIVDGGYFENSAAATLMDAVEAIERVVTDEHWDDVQLRIVLIDNEPVRPAGPAQSSSFLSEALSPLRALFATRTARGSYAFAHAVDYDSRCADLVDAEGFRRSRVFEFHLSDRGTNLPLGWTLSRNAIDEMDDQLLHPFEAVNNPVIISNLLRNLPARVAP